MSKFLDTSDIFLDKLEVLRYLGMPQKALTLELDTMITESMTMLKNTLRPRYIYQTFAIDESIESVTLVNSSLVLSGRDIKAHLKGAEQVVIMACTLGSEAERLIRTATVNDLVTTVVLDAIATEFIEKVCDKVDEKIMAEYIPLGYHSNFRFGPGYGDLPLSLQPEILAALDTQRQIALYCNEDNIMTPSKSVTGIFGLFKDGSSINNPSPCNICQFKKNCSKREGKQSCGYKN